MTIINHEYYVSHEIAKLLKEAGFDWDVYKVYELNQKNKELFVEITSWQGKVIREDVLPAPTLEVAQSWLRNVKGYIILINYNEFLKTFYYSICYTKNTNRYIDDRDDCRNTTFEEAKEAGIKRTLEIILTK